METFYGTNHLVTTTFVQMQNWSGQRIYSLTIYGTRKELIFWYNMALQGHSDKLYIQYSAL